MSTHGMIYTLLRNTVMPMITANETTMTVIYIAQFMLLKYALSSLKLPLPSI